VFLKNKSFMMKVMKINQSINQSINQKKNKQKNIKKFSKLRRNPSSSFLFQILNLNARYYKKNKQL